MIRQGDILIVRTDEIPATAQPIPTEDGRHILAHGEVTGHHHSILEAPSGTTALLATPNQEMYLLIKEGDALLEHQEHAAHVIPAGNYRVIRQREFDETQQQQWRRVAD